MLEREWPQRGDHFVDGQCLIRHGAQDGSTDVLRRGTCGHGKRWKSLEQFGPHVDDSPAEVARAVCIPIKIGHRFRHGLLGEKNGI